MRLPFRAAGSAALEVRDVGLDDHQLVDDLIELGVDDRVAPAPEPDHLEDAEVGEDGAELVAEHVVERPLGEAPEQRALALARGGSGRRG